MISAAAGMTLLCASLLYNADMSVGDGLGTPLGWNVNVRGDVKGFKVRSYEVADGPDGRPARVFSFASADGNAYLSQHPFELVAGETYRMGAYVRTSNLKGKVWFGFWNYGWTESVYVEAFPSDTDAKWQKVRWTGEMIAGRPTGYSFGVCGSTGGDPSAKVEICGLRFEPVSEKAIAGSRYGNTVEPKPCPVRIVPIDPKLAELPLEDAAMTFYYPGADLDGAKLIASVDGRDVPAAAFDARSRAKAALGTLTPGEHRLAVRVVDARGKTLRSDSYAAVASAAVSGPAGRRLNNFVTELHAGELKDGDVRYHRRRAGWTWISFDGASGEPEGFLDRGAVAVVRRRPHEPRLETMRYQQPGWHTLTVRGAAGGRVRIHAVKTLASPGWLLKDYAADYDMKTIYRHPYSFYRRYFAGGFNTVSPYDWHKDLGSEDSEINGFYAERGMRVAPQVVVSALDPDRLSADRLYGRIVSSQAFKDGCDIEIDEAGVTHLLSRACHVNLAETVWRLADERPRQRFSTDFCDAAVQVFADPVPQTTMISAIVNSGRGGGHLIPETYSAPQVDLAKSLEMGEGHFRRFAQSVADLVPGATESIRYLFATYVDLGTWCDYPNPETDLKFHYGHFLRTLATDPAFEPTLGGLAFSAAPRGEEEILRWFTRICRYYCLEGGTEDLAAKYGFGLLPGFVRDGDFAHGLKDWDVETADGGSVDGVKVKDYGVRIQRRQKVANGVGDGLAVFTASEKGPNRISQRLTGLVPGRHYALMYCTVDYDDLLTRKGVWPETAALCASLDGADEERELAFVHRVRHGGGKDKTVPLQLTVHRQVFQAKSDEATLSFADRAFDGSAAKPGTRRGLNYVIFRPYYHEGDEDLAFLRDMLKGVKKQ